MFFVASGFGINLGCYTRPESRQAGALTRGVDVATCRMGEQRG